MQNNPYEENIKYLYKDRTSIGAILIHFGA